MPRPGDLPDPTKPPLPDPDPDDLPIKDPPAPGVPKPDEPIKDPPRPKELPSGHGERVVSHQQRKDHADGAGGQVRNE